MSERQDRLVQCVAGEVRTAASDVLSEALAEHYSQAQWEKVVGAIVERLVEQLSENLYLPDILHQGDLKDPQGKINIPGIVAAMKEFRDRHQDKPRAFAVLKHLVSHLEHALESL